MKQWILKILSVCMSLAGLTGCFSDANKANTIAAAKEGSAYNIMAETIAGLINTEMETEPFTVESSDGSEANIRDVAKGNVRLAIAQEDILYDMVNSQGIYQGAQGINNVSAVCLLYPEVIHIVTLKNSGITSLDDLRKRTVAVGNVHSGTELNAFSVMRTAGLTEADVNIVNCDSSEACLKLKEHTIDAFFYTSGAPNDFINTLSMEEEIRLIPIEPDVMEELQKTQPYFDSVVIKKGTYPGVDTDVDTLAVSAVLITNNSADAEFVEKLCDVLYMHSADIEQSIRVDFTFDLNTAFSDTSIPYHKGADSWRKSRES